MDLTSGIFTSPATGIYFFSFTGLAFFPASSALVKLGAGLYLNGGLIGMSYVEEGNTLAGQNDQLAIQSTMNLKKGDQVWVAIVYQSPGAYLADNSEHHNHFTGFMLEEASLVESL